MTKLSVSRQPSTKSRKKIAEAETKAIGTSPPSAARKKICKLSPSSPYVLDSEEDDTPLRHIFCLKKIADLERYETTEDCFILDFDPSDSFSSVAKNVDYDDPSDLSVIAEKGKVACRDYPHPRHVCVKFPFGATKHEMHCLLCYCYVCDCAAPCEDWTATPHSHCDAIDSSGTWKQLRILKRCRPHQ